MSVINQVFRVRTEGILTRGHSAKKGSLVVIDYVLPNNKFIGFCVDRNGTQWLHTFRPCDLSRLEFHEEVNK